MLKRRHTTVAIVCFLFITAVHPFADCRADQVRWATDVEGALRTASNADRLVLMKFTADWCGYCKKMEKTTFADAAVTSLVNGRFVPVLVDADKHKDLVKHLKIRGLPAILVVSPKMKIVERITGYQTAERLLPTLNQILAAQQPPSTGQQGVVSFGRQTDGRMARPVSRPNPFGSQAVSKAGQEPVAQEQESVRPTAPRASPNAAAEANPFADVQFPPPGPAASNQAAPNPPGSPAEPNSTGTTVAAAASPAFDGLCLTSVVEQRRLVQGKAEVSTTYRGQRLVFDSDQQRQKFLSQPEKYWPMLDGACPLTLLRTDSRVTGDIQHAAVFRGRVWLFRSQELMREFIDTPAEFVSQLP